MGCREQRVVMVVLTVVELGGRFLVIREAKHGRGWYLPAGGVEVGESPFAAARRETIEEAGIVTEPEEVLTVGHELIPRDGVRSMLRFVIAARPLTFEPKCVADEHSLEARWLRLDEIAELPLRHPEVLLHIDTYRRRRSGDVRNDWRD